MLGFLITWTTYGTWLQGDKRGYVKDGTVYPVNKDLEQNNKLSQLQDAVILSKAQREVVKKAIMREAQSQGQRIFALTVQPNHIHIVVGAIQQPIAKVVALYKNAGRLTLKELGHEGRLWTKGYDKRFCYDEYTLQQKINYVQSHNPR